MCVALAVIFFVSASFQSGFSIANKKPNSLIYIENKNTKEAFWATYNRVLDEYTSPYFKQNATSENITTLQSKYKTPLRLFKATETRDILSANTTIVSDTIIGENRILDFVIQPKRTVNKIDLLADTAITFSNFTVNGVSIKPNNKPVAAQKGTILTYYFGNTDKELTIKCAIAKEKSLRMTIYETSYDLLLHKKFNVTPRKEYMMPMPFVTNDAIITIQKLFF